MTGGGAGRGREESEKAQEVRAADGTRTGGSWQFWALLGVALLAGAIVWLVTRDDNGAESVTAGFAPRIVDVAELREIAASAGHPVYWAGPPAGDERLEASEDEAGQVQVRYLTGGQEPDSDPAGTVTVGSYPLADPRAALESYAESPGSFTRQAGDRKLVSSVKAPSSVYFVSPEGSVQVEVYAPVPRLALALARPGRVEPVG